MKKNNELTEETVTWEEVTDNISSKKELESFIAKNINSQFGSFKEYFNEYIAENDMDLPSVMKNSNID